MNAYEMHRQLRRLINFKKLDFYSSESVHLITPCFEATFYKMRKAGKNPKVGSYFFSILLQLLRHILPLLRFAFGRLGSCLSLSIEPPSLSIDSSWSWLETHWAYPWLDLSLHRSWPSVLNLSFPFLGNWKGLRFVVEQLPATVAL